MIEAEAKKPVIEVDDYYDKVHQHAWARRTAGLMGGTTIGTAYGALIGAVAAFFPYILGAMGVAGAAAVAIPGIAAIATSAAILAGIGGLMGFAAVATVGSDAGSVAAGLAEKEKREKIEKLRADGTLGTSESVDISIKEIKEEFPKPYAWRTAIITIPLFTAFGALIGLNPLTAPALVGALGLAAGSTAAAAASAGIVGMFGAIMAGPNSFYTNIVSNFYYKVIKDKIFTHEGNPKEPEAVVALEPKNEVIVAPDLQMSHQPTKRFTTEKTSYSFQGMVEKTQEHSHDNDSVKR